MRAKQMVREMEENKERERERERLSQSKWNNRGEMEDIIYTENTKQRERQREYERVRDVQRYCERDEFDLNQKVFHNILTRDGWQPV